jgi:hypothetical protein
MADLRDLDGAAETVQQAAASGRKALEEGFESVREYGENSLDYLGQITESVTDYVKREPLLAVGAAFLAGYVAAQFLKRLR